MLWEATYAVGQVRRHNRVRPVAERVCSPSCTGASADGETWNITGDLSIKDVSHAVTIPFEQTGSAQAPFGNTRVGFQGVASPNRKDWGLSWNAALETGGVLVSDKIKLEFDISAVKNA